MTTHEIREGRGRARPGAQANAWAPAHEAKASLGRPSRLPAFALAISLFFILLVLPSLQAQATGSSVESLFGSYWQPWWKAFVIALAISPILVALSWMYGYAAADERFKAWAKKEVVEAAYSLLILMTAVWLVANLAYYVALLPSITPFQNDASAQQWRAYVNARCQPGLAGSPELERPCHIRLSEDYLQILFSGTQAQANDILQLYAPLAEASTFGLKVNTYVDPAGELGMSPFGGLSQPLETLSNLFDIASKNLMAIRAQQYIIDFLHLAFFPLFLSMGLFFRALPFTRRLGGLLIAIAFGFYVVFPLMYVFFHAVLFSMAGPYAWSPNAAGQYVPEQIGARLYPVQVDLSGQGFGLVKPNPLSKDYVQSATCGTLTAGVGDECNVGSPQLTCPPRGQDGKPVPGRENDLYCNTDSCKCQVDAPASFTAQYSNPTDYEANHPGSSAALLANICAPPDTGQMTEEQKKAQADKDNAFVMATEKNWLEAAGHGMARAVGILLDDAGGDLLGYNGFIDNLAKILIFSLVAPFIAIMAALAGVKALSPMLGGDVEIAGLTRLI